MKNGFLVVLLTVIQIAFFLTTAYVKPTDWFAAFYFAWILIPATFAAIVFLPNWHFTAAISNAVISALLFDYLFLQHGYFWAEKPTESNGLAIGYVVIAVVLAFIVSGFVHSIINRLNHKKHTRRTDRMRTAIKQGFKFAAICACAAFPIFTMFGPVGTGITPRPTWEIAVIGFVCIVFIGTLLAAMVGVAYNPKQFTETETPIAG